MKTWTEAINWDEWDVLDDIGRGGQGVVCKARHKESSAEGCIKKLSDQKKTERRARFAREAVAYDTCRHGSIPRLMQSNALQHGSSRHKLFIITEFVPGGTLTDWMGVHGRMGLPDASALFLSLLDTLIYMHGQGWVHRDIKPDNIILRDGVPRTPVLVDFGLSYKDGVTESFETEHGQELGNRFLRLPELGVGSEAKQDVRSDISFAGGVLFFVLTGMVPGTLSDENGCMPHQRPGVNTLLSSIAGAGLMSLLGFLDKAFSSSTRQRFATAAEMRRAFEVVVTTIESQGPEAAAGDLDFVVAHVNRQANQVESGIAAKVDLGRQAIEAAHAEVAQLIQPTYKPFFGGFKRVSKGVSYSNGFAHFERQEERFVPEFSVWAAGDEIVVRANGEVVYRTALEPPRFEDEFREIIRGIYAKGVKGLIEEPLAQVAARGYFKSKPLTNISLAAAAAKKQGRALFLVIFEAASPTYSQLDHVLRYFLEHQVTKDLVEQHFIAAVVPNSQPDAASLVPSNDPLEKALWVVMAPDGTLLAQETVYANAEEGLRRVRQVVEVLNRAT